jgi:hypothetical protein
VYGTEPVPHRTSYILIPDFRGVYGTDAVPYTNVHSSSLFASPGPADDFGTLSARIARAAPSSVGGRTCCPLSCHLPDPRLGERCHCGAPVALTRRFVDPGEAWNPLARSHPEDKWRTGSARDPYGHRTASSPQRTAVPVLNR